MAKGKSQEAQGIDKRVSEPVYPADILAETSLQMASVAAKGAWLWTLVGFWRDKTDRLEGTSEEFGRMWGCSVEESERVIGELERRKVCDVVRVNGSVTLVSRRLARRSKLREDGALRKQRERDKGDVTPMSQDCHEDVQPKKGLPSVSSSVSVSSSDVTNLSIPPKPPACAKATAGKPAAPPGADRKEAGVSSELPEEKNNGKKIPVRDACASDWSKSDDRCVMEAMPKAWRRLIRKVTNLTLLADPEKKSAHGRWCRMMQCRPPRVLATLLDIKRGKKQPKDVGEAMEWLFWRLNEGVSPGEEHYHEAKTMLMKARGE